MAIKKQVKDKIDKGESELQVAYHIAIRLRETLKFEKSELLRRLSTIDSEIQAYDDKIDHCEQRAAEQGYFGLL